MNEWQKGKGTEADRRSLRRRRRGLFARHACRKTQYKTEREQHRPACICIDFTAAAATTTAVMELAVATAATATAATATSSSTGALTGLEVDLPLPFYGSEC